MESKNSFKKGLEAEQFVLKDLLNKNCLIIGERIRTPFAEVDILFRSSKGHVVLLEVKTLSRWDWIHTRLDSKQTARLKRASEYFQSKLSESVIICAAFVIENKIIYLSID